ncbi:MAG: TatD family hydrolase [Candidatus Omnitrophota bacterium]|nr:TatD family hydrolase [Candidatus Omnitrophota bacterium]
MLLDAHCHITSLTPLDAQGAISLPASGFCFIDSSIDCASSEKSLALSSTHPHIYTALGFHPFCVKEYTPDIIGHYETFLCRNSKVVAIGEIGLDYKAETDAPLARQEEVLRAFLSLARASKLPVIIHNRFDSERIFEILDEFFTSYEQVVFHCFSYGPGKLTKIIGRGGFVSFSLNVLRKNKDILGSLAACPLEHMLLETDSPYMRVRGSLSVPGDIDKVYSFVAAGRGVAREDLEKAIFKNAKRLFFKDV